MIRSALPVAVACLVMAGCDNPADAYPGQISTTFDGGKQLVLVADYSVRAQATGISAWADVDVGTAATIEMTGPLHMHCEGTFQAVPKEYNDPGNRPALDVGEGTIGAQLHAPSGSYTVVVAIPSKKASIKKTFHSGVASVDPMTGVWDLPGGCVPVADTQQQFHDLATTYVRAVAYWVGRMDASQLRTELLGLATRANDAFQGADQATAVDALSKIRSSVRRTGGDTFEYRTYCESNSAIALLTQPMPAT